VAAPKLTEAELKFLDALLKHNVRFMLVGLSAAALQGAPVVTQDVDLWFEDINDPNLTKALKETGAAYVPPIELNPPMFAGSGTELFDIVLRMDGLKAFADEWANTINLQIGSGSVKVLCLERIIQSKLAANRPKDKLAIMVLQDTARSLEALKVPPIKTDTHPSNE
jgi:hypothetical protein